MNWQNKAQGEFAGDWLAGGFLNSADPYLLWLDVTRFSGAALQEGRTLVIPTIRQLEETVDLRFRTDAIRVSRETANDSLISLADPTRRGTTQRFEVAAGFDTGDIGSREREASKVPVPASTGNTNRTSLRARPLIGFIDYGCAFAHRQFRSDTGDARYTRVLAIWDQGRASVLPAPPAGIQALQWGLPTDFLYGAETHRDRSWGHAGALTLDSYIRQFMRSGQLDEETMYRHCAYPAIQGRSATHGTHVMDLATGWPDPLRGQAAANSVAHDADIVFVQLPRVVQHREISGLLRANVYDGIRYILTCAHKHQPVIINLSYGGNVGPHDGSSVLEQAIDWRLAKARQDLGAAVTLVVPAGNAREERMHVTGPIEQGRVVTFCWNNPPDDPSESFVEIWLPVEGDFRVRVTPPPGHGPSDELVPGTAGTWVGSGGKVAGAVVFAKQVCQSARGRMVLLAVARTRLGGDRPVAPYGRWEIQVSAGQRLKVGEIHAWCERDVPPFGGLGVPRQAYFTPTSTSRIDTDGTLNSIAHGHEVVVVGGQILGSGAAAYSGTGPGRGLTGKQRNPGRAAAHNHLRGPETLAASDESTGAPGLLAAAVYGSDKLRMAGTSMAAAVMTRQLFEHHQARAPRTALRPPRVNPHPDDTLAGF